MSGYPSTLGGQRRCMRHGSLSTCCMCVSFAHFLRTFTTTVGRALEQTFRRRKKVYVMHWQVHPSGRPRVTFGSAIQTESGCHYSVYRSVSKRRCSQPWSISVQERVQSRSRTLVRSGVSPPHPATCLHTSRSRRAWYAFPTSIRIPGQGTINLEPVDCTL